jgi:hypothetical protein
MIDRETAEKIYCLLCAGYSCSLVAERLGLYPPASDNVYKLRRGSVRAYRDLFERYRFHIPTRSLFHRPYTRPIVSPQELYEIAVQQPKLFMPMELPDVERYRGLNTIRHEQERLASDTAKLPAEFWRRLFPGRRPPA